MYGLPLLVLYILMLPNISSHVMEVSNRVIVLEDDTFRGVGQLPFTVSHRGAGTS